MLGRLCVCRRRVAFKPTRSPTAPATSTATATAAAFAAFAVLSAGPAIPVTPTATLATLLAGSRRGDRWARLTGRGFGSHHIAAWPEVGIDFHHANLGDLGNPTRTGAAGATARAAAESRAAHRNAALCRRRTVG